MESLQFYHTTNQLVKMQYTLEQLDIIKNNALKIENFMNESINWVQNSPNVIDKVPLVNKIKTQRRQVRKLIPRITEKPAVAFFGASQCGKSSLVKNLLKDENGELFIWDKVEKHKINFLKYINPDGNKNEATALVTRFQFWNEEFLNEFPLKIELLSTKDLILTLIDGFATIAPLGKIKTPSEEFLREIINDINNLHSNHGTEILGEDEVNEIKEYVEKYRSSELKSLLDAFEKINFWDIFAKGSPKFTSTNITKYVSIFWYNNKSVSGLFEKLLKSLELCQFSKSSFANFDIILKQVPPEYNCKFSKTVNILDVRVLAGFANDAKDTYDIFLNSTQKVSLLPHILCAISKEVSLCIPNEKNVSDKNVNINYGTNRMDADGEEISKYSLLENLDILDFPGCRPGTSFTSLDEIPLEQQIEIIKRGKINYLFNVYSDNYQINNLAIGSNISGQLDGASLIPHILNPWINNYIGHNAEERDENLRISKATVPPLFVILTYFNEILIYNPEKDTSDPTDKLNTALQTRLKEDIHADYSWMKDWGKNANQVFKNFYLLRDFTYCKLYNKESKRETIVKDEFSEYFKSVKEAFLKNSHSNQLFSSPSFNFDEASSPNKDGSQLIIKQLEQVKSNSLKTESIILKVTKAFETVKLELNSIKKSDNENDKIEEVRAQTIDVFNRIIALINDDVNVGVLTDQFSVDENEIYHVVYSIVTNRDFGNVQSLKKYYSFYLQYPELKDKGTYSERIKYLTTKFGKNSENETVSYLSDLGYDVNTLLNENVAEMEDKALYIANKSKSFWIENQLNIENFKSDKKALSPGFIQFIMNNIKNKYENLKLSEKIANHIRPFVENPGVHLDDVIPMISSIITGIINNHVSSFGWEYVEEREKSRLIKLCKENNIEILDSLVNEVQNDDINYGVPKLYDYLKNYASIVNNLKKDDVENIKVNPYISGYRKWIDTCNLSLISSIDTVNYDVKSNQELISILDGSNNIILA
jgi:hypothetical protein